MYKINKKDNILKLIIIFCTIIILLYLLYYFVNKNVKDKFTNLISNINNKNNKTIIDINKNNVFLYWVGNDYKLIKILRDLIYLHSNNGENYIVHLINKDNIKKYIQNIPEYFDTLLPAHQADYVRVCVICEYGGIWLDSDTLVMDNLKSLFNIIKNQDGFIIKQNNEILWNGVFGSKNNTPLMIEWRKQLIDILNTKKNNIAWTEIGNTILENIKNKNPNYYDNYKIFNGLENMYPINWDKCLDEMINKPYDNYKTFERDYQPVIVLVNSIYKELEKFSEQEILEGKYPLNYFINKSFENYNNRNNINNNFNNNFNSPPNIKLGIQTVFILKENLPFLREWIIYHLHIGFDKIFLYDNTGSIGIDSSNNEMNKYAFNFNNIINMDDTIIDNELQSILNDFKDNVIYIKWQPKNESGNIIYGQTDSIKHYIKNYGNLTDYTAYTDIDEYIFSVNNINIKDYIYNLSKDDITKIIINQKKFSDRFCSEQLVNIIDIKNTVESLDTSGWAPKIIIKNVSTNIENISNIHSIENINGKTINAPLDILRFNHYNVNKKQINWMKDFYNKQSINEFEYGYDNSMSRYTNIINSKCNNKCSNKNKFINVNEINKDFNNLCISKW